MSQVIDYPIRSQITAPKDYCIVELDLSAAEAHVVARLSNDENMIFQLEHGDIHLYTARGIYENPNLTKDDNPMERYIGKKTNHTLNYQGSAEIVTKSINKEGQITVSVKQVRVWVQRWHSLFNVKTWWDDVEYKLRNNDMTLVTAYGKKRKFWGFLNDEVKRAATAFEPQSVVSYHLDGAIHPELGIKGGLFEIQNQITNKHKEIKIINTAHDSVVLEMPTKVSTEIALQCKALLERPLMVNGHIFTIPVDCERFDRRWKEDGEHLKGEHFVRKASKAA